MYRGVLEGGRSSFVAPRSPSMPVVNAGAIAAHLAGVIYHRWFRHDDLLQRMLPTHSSQDPGRA